MLTSKNDRLLFLVCTFASVFGYGSLLAAKWMTFITGIDSTIIYAWVIHLYDYLEEVISVGGSEYFYMTINLIVIFSIFLVTIFIPFFSLKLLFKWVIAGK